MKKRLAFRSFVILLATALLLSSTGAYNLLVYANQDSVANSLSAIESASGSSADAETSEPEISVQGGELALDSDISVQLQAAEERITLQGEGEKDNPYIIMDAADFLEANKIVNAQFSSLQEDDTSDKYFRLGDNIDLTPLFAEGVALPFASGDNAYLVTTDYMQSNSSIVRFILDGSVKDAQGNTQYDENGNIERYTISCDEKITVPLANFAIFGYLSEQSSVSNIIFENINIESTSNQPKRMAVISYMNAGTISNCEIVNSKIELVSPDIKKEETDGPSVTIDSYVLYNGIAAAVSDNRANVENVKVKNFTVNLPENSSNDYVAGLVGQNRGIVESSSVSGVTLSVNHNNHYIGGLVGYNETNDSNEENFNKNGIQNCSVDFAGTGTTKLKNNINGGAYVGGLVGYNKGYVYNSTVTGSVTSAQSASVNNYNIYCGVDCGKDYAYYGGITAVNNGRIVSTTAYNVGAFMADDAAYDGYYGGIAAIAKGSQNNVTNIPIGTISGCVATGSFVSANKNYGYAGGILAYADDSTPDGAVSNSYALVRLSNPSKDYVGAVIGFGGNAAKATGCYWSDAISKCATAFVFIGKDEEGNLDPKLPYVLDTKSGKLNSSERAVVVSRGGEGKLNKEENIHTFNAVAGTNVANVIVNDDVLYTGSASNNELITKVYEAEFDFVGTGAGASSMQKLDVSIALDVFVTNNATGDPDYDPANGVGSPLEIKSSAMAKYIYLAPYGNYKLTTDIAVTEAGWTKTIFTGSIYGDNNKIGTDTKLFTAVIGTRDKSPAYKEDAVSDPVLDTADRKGGYISNLNIELAANMDESVFGTVYDSTIVNVALTDSDPTPDDGDEEVYEGFITDLTDAPAYTAAFIDRVIGNSYIYGCSTDVSVKFGESNYLGGFIAYVSGAVVIDNCFVNAISIYTSGNSNEDSRAAFVADSLHIKNGLIVNSIVSARVVEVNSAYTVFGTHRGENNEQYKNIIWSKLDYNSTYKASDMYQSGVSLWGGESVQPQSMLADSNYEWSVDIPKHISAFESASTSDFTLSLVYFDSNVEKVYSGTSFVIEKVVIENDQLKVTVQATDTAQKEDSVFLKVNHYETGFQTYVNYVIVEKSNDFVEKDGYIILSSKEDLIRLSNIVNDENNTNRLSYLSKAYKLGSDISMVGTTFEPIGNTENPFTGIFDGDHKTISGLTIAGTDSYSAIFAAVNFSKDIEVNGQSVKSGIYNLTLDGINVIGGDSTAILVGTGISKVNIHDIQIISSSVTGTGKSAAAVVASMSNCDADIYNILLDTITVQTSYTDGSVYFKNTTDRIGGIGAVIGSAEETDTVAHTININGITANNINVSGANDGHATVNAGGLIGTYQKYYSSASSMVASSLNIGDDVAEDENSFDITVSNLVVKSAGNAGGIVAATNAKTTIKNVKVTADSEYGTTIHSTTELYIGGIAGYVGQYSLSAFNTAANAGIAVANIYGSVANCMVENAEIKTTDSSATKKSRNVIVGGIVGAINGPISGNTLENCLIKNSHIEGIVVGGMVGSNVNICANKGNILHINNCDVVSSQITTPEECNPAASDLANNSGSSAFGVGGILGTSTAVYAAKVESYITDLIITRCDVNSETIINNFVNCKGLSNISATGGLIGLSTQYLNGVQTKLNYNTVSAQILSTADMKVDTYVYPELQHQQICVGTGGFIGSFMGLNFDYGYVAYMQKLSITDSVFDGSIVGTDCIGGAVGSVVSAYTYEGNEDTHLPKDLLKNVIISGSLKSSVEQKNPKLIRGGITFGSIAACLNYEGSNEEDGSNLFPGAYTANALQMVYGIDDMTYSFSDIYFSSFNIDSSIFPLMGYCGVEKDFYNENDSWFVFVNNYELFELLKNTFFDVNLKANNQTKQLADKTSGSNYSLTTFPAVTRGDFSLNVEDENGQKPQWNGSNSSIATVSETSYNSLTVKPKNPGTINVSIDYIGSVSDGAGWSYEARLPVGFKFTSTAYVDLETVNYGGKTYYLITDPIDFKFILRDNGAGLSNNYWLANSIEFTPDMFESNGTYPGGFTALGTADKPFTGTFGSRKDTGSEQFEISGLQLAATNVSENKETNPLGEITAASLFGYTQNASFENIKITDVTSTADAKYAAAVAAVATGSLNAVNVTVENAQISGADYSAGLFGGLFGGSTGSWNISDSQLKGENTADGTYTTTIQGDLAAAGILVHTDSNAASIKGVTVSGSAIIQGTDNDTDDSTYFDNGAAGIAFAYSGDISANGNTRNTVENSLIKGEIAAGAVVRTYTSYDAIKFGSFKNYQTHAENVAERVSINAVDIVSSIVEGTHTWFDTEGFSNETVSSAGILARVDAPSVNHTITDCSLDAQTTVKAPYGVGGIVGCFEAPTNTTVTRVYNVTIDSCKTSARIIATESDNAKITDVSQHLYYTMGAGGIIGSLSKDTYLSGIHITNCHVGGTISGDSAVGGLVGAIWTSGMTVDAAKFNRMNHHFAENCVITASFKNLAGEDSFVKKTSATGIVVGYIYDFEANGSTGVMGSSSSFSGYTNQPFFNIYFSGYKYPSGSAYLFGVLKPALAGNDKSANVYKGFTDYIYDINSYAPGEDNEPGKENYTINDQTRALTLVEQYRIKHQKYDKEENITPINSLLFATGYYVSLSEFSFDAQPQNSSETNLNYVFDSSASINSFTVSAINKASDTALEQTAVLMPESVKTDSNKISVKAADGGYILAPAEGITLTETVEFNLVFTYSNGMELAAAFVVEVSGNDYYYNETANTYFIFNASNLYSTIEKASASSTIIQCYDIFCSIENGNALINSANTYAESVTLSQVMSADDLALLSNSVHPNPKYELGVDDRTEIDIEEYLGVSDLANVKLSKLVDGVSETQYGTYTKNSSDHFDLDFAGTYRVLTAVTVDNVNSTGLTAAEEYFSVYGFESHEDINVTAQGEDAEKSGFFNSLNGATVTGLTFVNPKIEVIGYCDAENFVGVLAGTATNATITDVSVERIGEQGKAYVMSLRQNMPASTNVGGLVGAADAATSITGCSVSGLDVVGATLAGNTSGKLYTVKVGGIAGSSAAEIKNASVADSRILAERYDRFRNTYVSYAGGIAAWATGNITDAKVENTQLRDATCSVNVAGTTATGSYVANADDHEPFADRIGGVVAHAYGTVNIASAKLYGVSITAFDTAGGIIGEIENDDKAAVTVTNSSAGDYSVADSDADIRVLSSSNLSTSNLRQFYNVAGGIVGKVDNLASLNISGSGFSGYVGTYSYDNLNKDCTAGGVIGYISESLGAISAVTVVDTTVSGEVSGFRSGKDKTLPAYIPYLGAAGGYIGKIRSTAADAGSTPLVSHGVMSAEVNLYTNSTGTKVDASAATVKEPQNVSTNVGKILGFAIDGTNFATSAEDLTAYFENIYVSSYPQDIIAYGCKDFYGQKNTAETYTDINVATYDYTEDSVTYTETGKSFMVGTATDVNETTAADDNYANIAVIPIDTDSGTAASASRHFKLAYNNIKFKSDEASTDIIKFDSTNGIRIALNDGETEAEIKVDSYNNPYGTLTISNVKEDIIGEIVLSYSYGLEVGVQLISMEIEGMGVEGNEFLISAPKHFAVVRALPDAYYKQVNNIDLAPQYGYSTTVTSPLWADGQGFEPIGTKQIPFVGSYDGGGYLITNLYINRSSDYVGLFGCVGSGAELKNIHIELSPARTVNTDPDNFNIKADLVGGITANSYVGGLAGRVNDATVTNCSVVKGNVIGDTALGGLIGESAGATIDSCFTSTTVYSKLTGNLVEENKNAGGLVGYITSYTKITGSFTFGFTSIGVAVRDNGIAQKLYGSVGGLVGYVDSIAGLDISDVFVGSSISASEGVNGYKGLTIGGAASSDNITAKKLRISAAVAATDSTTSYKINPVLGVAGGVNVPADSAGTVIYDADLMGLAVQQDAVDEEGNPIRDEKGNPKKIWVLDSSVSDEVGATPASGADFTLDIELPYNSADSYTAAYAGLAKTQVDPAEKELTDRTNSEFYRGGLFYPVTLTGNDIVVSSSRLDTSVGPNSYPSNMDTELYGDGKAKSIKNTDLLFKDVQGSIKVHTNVFREDAGQYDGKIYPNGEMFYDSTVPYVVVTKANPVTVDNTSVELYRKVVYPMQIRMDDIGRIYPISTERQLNSITVKTDADKNTKYFVLTPAKRYILTNDIVLGNYKFTPIPNYSGNFDGNGFKISNLNIEAADNAGFIATMVGGSLNNMVIEVGTISGGNNVGGLVGLVQPAEEATVSINNCSVSNLMKATESDDGESADLEPAGRGVVGGNNVGGLVGYAKGGEGSSISHSFAQVTVSGTNVVGGLVGHNEMAVDNSYATGDVNATITGTYSGTHGIGGLVGVSSGSTAIITASFSSSAVDVALNDGMTYNTSVEYGVGGLVGHVGDYAGLSAVFSSGSVRYSVSENDSDENNGENNLPSCQSTTLGVGGLVGVLGSTTINVYSSASVAASFGDVSNATAVGAGGVIGIAKEALEAAYSSGSTLGKTNTESTTSANYGVGGVIGVITDNANATKILYDINVSAIEFEEDDSSKGSIGKVISGSYTYASCETTANFTDGKTVADFLGATNFGSTVSAYPYLTAIFKDNVSRTIQFNALLSVVAIELNPLDQMAAEGKGISMAMNIPTEVSHNDVVYTFGFEADNTHEGSAKAIVDPNTNTLSVQRSSNREEQANFIITIETVGGKKVDPDDGVVYSTVASRPLSRICAAMLGTDEYPFLVASQEDMKHVAMTDTELGAITDTDSLYREWNGPLEANSNPDDNKVYYRMMGNIYLDSGYTRDVGFFNLKNGYSFDGNGYFVHGLRETLADTVNEKSVITNVTFKDTVFDDGDDRKGESLVGSLSGTVNGVNVFSMPVSEKNADGSLKYTHTRSSGNNVAGIAQTVEPTGRIDGCVANIDWKGTAGDSFAGIALTNNGTITMSAAVGDITGSANSAAAFVGENNGTISACFTMGDIILDSPAASVSGFVGTNNSAIMNSYTRCNIIVRGEDNSALQAGSFAAVNSADSSINACYAAGLFTVDNAGTTHVFIGHNDGSVNDSMFDKQMSGSSFADDFYLAERTLEVATLSTMNAMARNAYVVSDNAGKTASINEVETVVDIEYPQLNAILATAEDENSRMYNTLRSYSNLSSAGAMVNNDNYIDYLPYGNDTVISNKFIWKMADESVAQMKDFTGGGKYFTTNNNPASTIISVRNPDRADLGIEIEEYHSYAKEESKIYDTYNLYITVNNNPNPNFSGGNGTVKSPYIIATKEQVVALSFYGSNPDSYFIIAEVTDAEGNDIDDITNGALDMTGTDWGAYIDLFSANLDGRGYTLSNVTIPPEGDNALIGVIDGGNISNLGIAGITVNVPEGNTDAAAMLAAKAMNNTSSITNCVVVGTVIGPDGKASTSEYIGGLIGDAQASVIIDGCVVSGKIVNSEGSAGGIIGKAENGVSVTNSLSTVLVDGGNSTAGGVIGSGPSNGLATVTNTVFAGNVNGATVGNIVGNSQNTVVKNSYYDKQLSMVATEESGVTAASTHFLTSADVSNFGIKIKTGDDDEHWTVGRIKDFAGYPVSYNLATGQFTYKTYEDGTEKDNTGVYGEAFMNAVKLASARISFANGVSVGSVTNFTSATVSDKLEKATIDVTGDAVTGSTKYIYADSERGIWNTSTSNMPLNKSFDGELEYKLDGMTRYVTIVVGKVIQTVTYEITGISSGNSIVSAITGEGNNASAATAFDTARKGILCNDMVFAYQIDANNNAQFFRVDTRLPQGYKVGAVKAYFKNGENLIATADTSNEENASYIDEDGIAYIIIPVNNNTNFNTVEITVQAVEDTAWGVHKLVSIF